MAEELYKLIIDGGSTDAFMKEYTKEQLMAKKDYIDATYGGRYKVEAIGDADTSAIDDAASYTVSFDGSDFAKTYTGAEFRAKKDYLDQNYGGRYRVTTTLGSYDNFDDVFGSSAKDQLDAFRMEHGAFMDEHEAKETAYQDSITRSLSGYLFADRPSKEERQKYEELAKQEDALKKAYFTSDEYLLAQGEKTYALSQMQKQLQANRLAYAQANPVNPQDPYASRGAEADAEMQNYETAERIMHETVKLHNAPSKYDPTTGIRNMAVGAEDELTNAALWTAGLSEIADNLNVRGVLTKVQEQLGSLDDLSEEKIESILTPAEQAVLQAWAINAQTQLERTADLSRGYQAGKGAVESLGFMAEFALTGGVGKATAEGAETFAKWLGKKIFSASDEIAGKVAKEAAEEVTEGVLKKYGKNLGLSLAEAAGRTGVMPSTFRNISEKALEIEEGEHGELRLIGMNKAFVKGVADSFIENLSEGGRVNALGGLVGDTLNKIPKWNQFTDWLTHTKVGNLYTALQSSGIMNTLRAGGWHGIGEEYLEEWYGNAIRTITGLDKDALKEFASRDNQMVTIASFLPLTIFGGAVSTGQVLSAKKQLGAASQAWMSALQDRAYSEAQAKQDLDLLMMSSPAEIGAHIDALVEREAQTNTAAAARLSRVGNNLMKSIIKWQAFNTKYKAQETEQRKAVRDRLSESMQGKAWWMTDKKGNETVVRATNDKGDVVFVTSKASVPGEQMAGVRPDGSVVFFNEGEYQLEGEVSMDTFLGNEVMAEKADKEKARMLAEKDAAIAEIKKKSAPGMTVVLGTKEAPLPGKIVKRYADGVAIETAEGVVMMTYEQLGNYVGENAIPLTDDQIDNQEADVILAKDAQREADLDAEYGDLDSAEKNEEEAIGDAKAAIEKEESIPVDSEGNVDEQALWNEDPSKWAAWNDEQRQDGGANSQLAINAAMNALAAEIAEAETAYAAMPVGPQRNAMEQEINAKKGRLQALNDIAQSYAVEAEAAVAEEQVKASAANQMSEQQKEQLDEQYESIYGQTRSLNEKARLLQEYLDKISEGSLPVVVLTRSNYAEAMRKAGCSQRLIDQVTAKLDSMPPGGYISGFNAAGKLFLMVEGLETADYARRTYVHERQHGFNTRNMSFARRIASAMSRQQMLDFIETYAGDAVGEYLNLSDVDIADELICRAMESVYTFEDFSVDLQSRGIPTEVITIINEINDEQRNDINLANSRRGRRRTENAVYSTIGDLSQDGRDSEQVSRGVLEQEAVGSSGYSERGAGDGEGGEGAEPAVDENGVTAQQNEEINKAVGGELEIGDESAPIRMSATAIAEGVGLQLIKDDGEGNVAIVLPDGRIANANHLLTPEDIKELPDSVLSYMMKDAKSLGMVGPAKEWMLWNKYTMMLNAILVKGSAENGGFEHLSSQWQWVAESIYKTVAINADSQYSYSLDITRVCKKNEAVITAIAEMQRRLGYGITPAQIMDIYLATEEAGYQVPCPVCYVFSRYIRNGKFATIMINGQRKYGDKLVDPRTLTEKEKQERIKFWLEEKARIEAENEANKQVIAKANEDIIVLMKRIDDLAKVLTDPRSTLTDEQKAEVRQQILDMDARYKAALNVISQASLDSWITQFAIHEVTENKKKRWVLYEDTYMGFPEEMALDLRETATVMREFPAIQRFRNSRGSPAGKEITFASNNDLGDVPMALGSQSATKDLARPRDISDEEWEQMQGEEYAQLKTGVQNLYQQAAKEKNPAKKKKLLAAAKKRFAAASIYAKQQTLRGGQRMWSWSDNIERLAPDVFVNLLQMEMLGGALQAYSKQLEGIKLVAAMNGYINGSLMGKGNGYKEISADQVEEVDGKLYLKDGDFVVAESGKKPFILKTPVYLNKDGKYYTLEFDDVVGVDPFGKTAEDGHHLKGLFELNQEYDRAGNIIVGMNDIHVRIAMADDRIFFIIPWHSSGANSHILAQMYEYLGVEYDVTLSQDYTDVQGEKRYKAEGEKEEDEETTEETTAETAEPGKKKKKKESSKITEHVVAFWNDHYENAREIPGYGKVAGKDFRCGIKGGIESSNGNGHISESQAHYRELRDAIFVGVKVDTGRKNKDGKPIYKTLTVEEYSQEWFNEIMNDEFLSQVYAKVRAAVGEKGFMTSQDCKAIYPYEYWDETSTYGTADINGVRYLEYCRRLGYKPKFCGKLDGKPESDYGNFTDDRGYWKVLIDRRMYGLSGAYQGLTPVTAENFTPDLVDPEKTKEEFVVTKVADEQGTQQIVDAALAREESRLGGQSYVDYDLTLSEATSIYEGKRQQKPKAVKEANPKSKPKAKKAKVSETKDIIEAAKESLKFSVIGEVGALRDKTSEGIARLENLDVARQMEQELNPDWAAKENEAALKIKIATGWERGADGLWRYEVEDVKAKPLSQWLRSKQKLYLSDILEPHPILSMYPDLGDITIKKGTSRSEWKAHYSYAKQEISLPFSALKQAEDLVAEYGDEYQADLEAGKTYMEESILHEIQHAIQHREGFARGSHWDAVRPEYRDEYRALHDEFAKLANEYNALYGYERTSDYGYSLRNRAMRAKNKRDAFWQRYKLGMEGYMKVAGEVESRNVEKRRFMSAEERRNMLLSSTEDVAREDQIFIMDAVGQAEEAEKEVRFSVIEPHQSSMDEIDTMFREYNADQALAELYDKVSALAHTMDLKIRFDYPWSDAAGSTFADKVKFNTEFFNSLIYMPQDKARGLLHEMIHAVTQYAIFAKNTNALTPEMKDAVKQLEDVYEEIKNDSLFAGTYGSKSVHEMVAELANPAFRDLLKAKSLYQRIVDAIKKLLGIEVGDNALDNVSATLDYMIDNYDGATFNAVVNALGHDESYVRFSAITPEVDAKYLAAVEAGDMETAQRMVIEAAKIAMPNTKVVDEYGNPKVMYHGTTQGVWNSVDHSFSDDGISFFTTSSKDVAWSYKGEDYAPVTSLLMHKDAGWMLDSGEWSFKIEDFVKDGYIITEQQINDYYAGKEVKIERPLDKAVSTKRIFNLFVDLKNPLIISNDSPINWDELTLNGKRVTTREASEYAIRNGYDGVIIENVYDMGPYTSREDMVSLNILKPSTVIISHKANQIKSADTVTYDDAGNIIPLSRRFNPENEDIRFSVANENQAIFVSNAARAVEGIKMEKATPTQWLAMIEKSGGLKAGEDKWMGLSDWLKASDKKTLTKQEVLDFIGEHMIQIEEQHYAEEVEEIDIDQLWDDYRDSPDGIDAINWQMELNAEYYADEYAESDEDWEEKYNEYLEDDLYGTNLDRAVDEVRDEWEKTLEPVDENGARAIRPLRLDYTTEGLDNKREIALTVPTIKSWNEDDAIHFGDAGEGRAVAWIRFGETTTESGEKVLVIDEIQSKRHQEGREKGYVIPVTQAAIDAAETDRKIADQKWEDFTDRMTQKYGSRFETLWEVETYEDFMEKAELEEGAQIRDEFAESLTRIDDLKKKNEALVPEAPFEKNWHELAMKRMLRYAAEEGYDAIAWTKGEQQAERYGIAKVVKDIYVASSDVERYVSIKTISGDAIEVPTEPNSDVIVSGDYKGQRLSDVVGKELADKILSVPEGTDDYISGDDLKVGGEGMKGFYDKMLPAFMNKYGKKWGVKVEDIELPNLEEAGRIMHSVPVTDAMKESVMEGQVMFSAVSITPEVREEMDRIAANAIIDGNYMLAPNGQPTKLNADQWALVRTQNFINWFGDWMNDPENASKVVDPETGEPKVVYHQTNASVYINRETGQNWDELGWKEKMEWDERDDWDEYWEEQDFNTFSRVNARTTNEFDGFFFAPEYDEYHEYGDRTIPAFLNIKHPASREDYNIDSSKNDAGRDERIRLQNEGFDGVIRMEGDEVDEYIAFGPNQIKSAVETTGEFSESEDIRFSVGDFGEVYEQFRGKPKEAIAFLMEKQSGEAAGALYHPEIGEIDLVWGEAGTGKSDGYGLAKLVKFHPEVIDNLQEILSEMHIVKQSANRVNLESEKYQAAVRLTWNNKAKKWLLTAFEKKNSALDNTTDTGETSKGSKQNDTATLQSTVSESKVTNNFDSANESEEKVVADSNEAGGTRFSVRTNPAPVKTQDVYKLMRLGADGKLYPLFIGSAEAIELETWYDADSPNLGDLTKLATGIHLVNNETGEAMTLKQFKAEHPEIGITGKRPNVDAINWATANGMRWIEIEDKAKGQKRYGGEARSYFNLGINGSGQVGQFAMRPGWHAGSLPTMRQIGKGPDKYLRDDSFVWVKGRVPADIDYQAEADANPDKDIPTHIPTDGYYMKATNANAAASQADRVGWYVAGSFIADEIISDEEARRVIAEWNEEHPDAQVKYDFRREGGMDFVPEVGMVETTLAPAKRAEDVVAEGLSLTNQEFARLAGEIFAALPKTWRRGLTDKVGNILDMPKATMQTVTRLAEKEEWTEREKELAKDIRNSLMDILDPSGIDIDRPLTTKEALWMLYNALETETDIVSEAKRSVVAHNLGFDIPTLSREAEAKDEVRFSARRSAKAEATARLYNKAATNVWTRLKETFVDMFASVEDLVKAIEKVSGKVAEGFENIILALNQQSSRGFAAMEKYEQEFLDPMFEEIEAIMNSTGMSYDDVVRYVILKHGLERNVVFAKRDAREFYEAEYQQKVAAIKANNNLTDAEKKAQEAEAEKELDQHITDIEWGIDEKFKELRKKDYSGITSMFYDQLGVSRENFDTEEAYQSAVVRARKHKFDNLADVEAAAATEVKKFEDLVNTEALWKTINASTKEILRQQYEASMISKESYDKLKDMFKFYVPLRGFKDNTAEDMYTYYQSPNSTGYTKPILAAEGRSSEAESPFGWIASMASSAIASNVKNEARLALYYFIVNRPDNGLATISKTWYVHNPGEVTPDGKKIFKPSYPPLTPDMTAKEAKDATAKWQQEMEAARALGNAYESGKKLNLGDTVVNISESSIPEHAVKVKVGGKDYVIFINGNPRAAQAINGNLNVEADEDYSKVFGKLLRWMSSVNTSYNPEFWVTNMQRDMLFTMMAISVKEDAEYRKAFAANYGKAFNVIKLVARHEEGTIGDSYLEEMYKQFVAEGGVTGYTQIKDNEIWEEEIANYMKSKDKERQKMGMAMKKAKDGLHKIHRFGESLEQVSRFAAFLTSREMGRSMAEAISDAKEITVNFNRKGSGRWISPSEARTLTDKNGQPLNGFERFLVSAISSISPAGRRAIMFFNAAIQGLNATYKLFKANPAKMIGVWSLGYMSVGVMNALLHDLWDDDDDYLDMPQYERRGSLMLGGGGFYFKWALPQEAKVFYALGDIFVEQALGRNPQKWYDEGSALREAVREITEVSPVNPLEGWRGMLPSVLVPVAELIVNEDYKGQPIFRESKWMDEEETKRTARWSRAYEGTGMAYVGISQLLNNLTGGDDRDAGIINIPPEAMEHIVQSSFGGTIRTLDKFVTTVVAALDQDEPVTMRQAPFLNRLFVLNDERFKNVYVNEVYDYYKAEAVHAKKLEKGYKEDRDIKKVFELRRSKEYRMAKIYEKYKKPIEKKQEQVYEARSWKDRKRLQKELDALKKRMIKEISNL